MKITAFKDIAFEALSISYSDSQLFRLSFDRNVTKITEYFITVNLCKQLFEWNSKNNYPYKIEAEKETFEFYRNCFESSIFKTNESYFPDEICVYSHENFLKNISSIRKGRIDITISKEIANRNISTSIIEVKSINPPIAKLKEDYDRIQQYLNSSIPGFQNSLENGFIVFVKHINNLKKIQTQSDLSQQKESYLKRIKKVLTGISSENIDFVIHTDDIENSPFENLNLNKDDDDYNEIAYRTFLAFAVIIELKICHLRN
ncbi:hypothetical protein [Chryseobacterium sp. RLHN22]|uniref:hypothetical protein n=1 Tax=Chryseobacterium sp. RLHN22 TaxID=3437885 RepID=UPI003D9BBEC1